MIIMKDEVMRQISFFIIQVKYTGELHSGCYQNSVVIEAVIKKVH